MTHCSFVAVGGFGRLFPLEFLVEQFAITLNKITGIGVLLYMNMIPMMLVGGTKKHNKPKQAERNEAKVQKSEISNGLDFNIFLWIGTLLLGGVTTYIFVS